MQQLLPCHIFYHGSSILHHVCAQMSWLKVWVPGEGDLRVEGAIPAGAWYVEFQGILGPGRTGWAWVRDRSTNELWFLRHQPMQDARYSKKDVWSQYTWDWESWWKCFSVLASCLCEMLYWCVVQMRPVFLFFNRNGGVGSANWWIVVEHSWDRFCIEDLHTHSHTLYKVKNRAVWS